MTEIIIERALIRWVAEWDNPTSAGTRMSEEFPNRPRIRLLDSVILLVVLGVLFGLLLPAIQHRDPLARRSVCTNNLRHLATGTAVFHSERDRYPGWAETTLPDHGGAGARDYGWFIALAPYLDYKTLSDEWKNPRVKLPPEPYVPLLWCPSKGSPGTSRPILSYVANVGLLDSEENRPANGVFLDHRVRHSNGKLARTPVVTLDHVVDGASNTILFSENLDAGEWPEIDRNKIGIGWWKSTTPAPEMRINGKRPQSGSPVPLARPSSRHPGGVMAALCDGSTRFLSQDIEYRVYIQLLTPDDQQSDMPAECKRIKLSNSDFP